MAFPVMADERAPESALTGFYGGLSMRDRGNESDGLQFGHISSAWGKFTPPATEDVGPRALAFGGYRWGNDIAVEAAVASTDRFALRPDGASGRPGMGLAFANASEAAARTWNADVYTSWGFAKKFSLYGRLGYIQSETLAANSYSGGVGNTQRIRDGVNYGLGMRYDINRVLGLRLEYARYGRLAGEPVTGVLPESDQVQFGMQLRF
ncbi:MAG: outer membrane beta-barrel protein [Betaproteobacteria bacterium]